VTTVPPDVSGGAAAAAARAGATVTALVYPAGGHPIGAAIVLGHGAGAGQQSAFMVGFAQALAALGTDVVTFNFPYTEHRRKIPDRAPVLESCFRSVIERVREEVASARHALFIGGKSMGGRIATQVAAGDGALDIAGLVLLGYPLHPPGKPDQRRDRHLPDISEPMLFVQGTRDPFGTAEEIRELLPRLNARTTLFEVQDGDHSFGVRVSVTGKRPDAVLTEIFDTVASFIRTCANSTSR
jgi:predicted alpha/beta-hydrolase family hydrolase